MCGTVRVASGGETSDKYTKGTDTDALGRSKVLVCESQHSDTSAHRSCYSAMPLCKTDPVSELGVKHTAHLTPNYGPRQLQLLESGEPQQGIQIDPNGSILAYHR